MIYEKIKRLCDEKNISIYRVEKDLEFSTSTITKWKESSPTFDNLVKVADYLGVPIDYFKE